MKIGQKFAKNGKLPIEQNFAPKYLSTQPVNQPEKIDQPDSFLPTTESACKTVTF